MATLTYDFDEVIATLRAVVDHDWTRLINEALRSRGKDTSVDWLERGGYELVYRPYRTRFCKSFDANANQLDMRFSIGLTIGGDGTIQEVMWGSAAFEAGLVSGALIQKVNGEGYTHGSVVRAIADAAQGTTLLFTVRTRPQSTPKDVEIKYTEGHRFPHLRRLQGARPRVDEIFAAR